MKGMRSIVNIHGGTALGDKALDQVELGMIFYRYSKL